jgi:hypothetical protein
VRRRIVLEIVTPYAGMIRHMPGGFAYADQMLSESGLAGRLNQALDTDDEALWLRRCLAYLDRRFQRWLQVRFIEPLTPLGLFKVIRHRIRTYPTFILGGETYTGHDLAELETFIRRQAGSLIDDQRSSI